jgi:phytoene dehydrogenase-like protein
VPGGGCITEELLLPGYGIDTCATGHTLIRVNSLLTGDELGLIANYGLRYIDPDPVAHVAFPDGEQVTMWLDRDRTVHPGGSITGAPGRNAAVVLLQDLGHDPAEVLSAPPA